MKQIRLLRLVVSAGSTALLSVLWYGIRFGREFAESCEFCGLDVFFFCLGNYPKDWGKVWIPDHYVIASLPFLFLMEQLIAYVDTTSLERIYYISFRRGNMWKQAVYDFKRVLFMIWSWLFVWEWTEKILFSFLYGRTESSFFIGKGFTPAEEFIFLNGMILRQVLLLLFIFLFVYGILFWAGLFWATVLMAGAVIAMVLLGFARTYSPFVLSTISAQIEKPLILFGILLLILFAGRKYMKKLYLN